MKIAVLEDNPDILEYMKTALEMAGHQVDTFIDGYLFLQSLLTGTAIRTPLPYDLVTIDLLLPGTISGLEAIKRIRQDIPAHQLPIIVITGVGVKGMQELQSLFPTIPVLHKPFRLQALLQLIDSF
ncbi:MAG TPA: response regulator [Ktedonobacteraceae bacterium]|nr:response regulator [Ktedonobacteraceae bacterium]